MLKLLFTGAMFLLLHTAYAQIQIGIKAGVNVSNFTGDFGGYEPEALTSPHGGVFLRWRFGTHLALQPEVVFSVQGASITDPSTNTEEDYKASYVNIPIMLQYHFNGGLYIEGGPQVGFKVDEDIPGVPDDILESNDVALALGLGYQLKGGLGIGARYTFGMSNVVKDSDDDNKNGVWQFSLFYMFFNKK